MVAHSESIYAKILNELFLPLDSGNQVQRCGEKAMWFNHFLMNRYVKRGVDQFIACIVRSKVKGFPLDLLEMPP
jgi:hypothetical protein